MEIKKSIYEWAIKQDSVNSVKRHLITDCVELYKSSLNENIGKDNFKSDVEFNCYGCCRRIKYSHNIYVYSCTKCGDIFQRNRYLTGDLSNYIILVIGARTKLGHQIVIKLLEAGATVIGTSRYPERAMEIYKRYDDCIKDWKLEFYPESFDLDVINLECELKRLYNWVENKFGELNGVIFNAAQTIRCKEKNLKVVNETDEKNRYGDFKYVPDELENSWNLKITEITQKELEEVHRINAIAPFLTVKHMLPLIQKSENVIPYIIHVHAREGIFDTKKADMHVHTNMAKASLHMFTKCLKDCKYKCTNGNLISINGVNCAWFSQDEYYKDKSPWVVPPLDEIDGAARILYPLFKQLKSCGKTRNHFYKLTY